MSDFVRHYAGRTSFQHSNSWVVLSDIEQKIKAKVELVSTPLKDWDIEIYRGILTGYNEAFIISEQKRQEILDSCKTVDEREKSDQLIRPILRGRDIKRYGYNFEERYLIATFPSKNYDIDEYPALKYFLEGFKAKLKQTGEPLTYKEVDQVMAHAKSHGLLLKEKDLKTSRKKTNNKWFETQDSISYWDDFSKQKIVWGEISDKTKFSLDKKGDFFTEATTFLMVGGSLVFLLGYLNSKLSEWIFSKIATTTGVGTVRWKKFTIEQLPVPKLDNASEAFCYDIMLKIIDLTNNNKDYLELEKQFNSELYKFIGLTTEEIDFIEIQ